MNPHKLIVGQKLWFVAVDTLGRTLGGTPITIKKIGRRWAETGSNGGHIDLTTLKTAPSSYPQGRAYLSKEAFDAENAVERAWRTLARAFSSKFHAPEGVTVFDIAEAARLLRLPVEAHRG